MSVDEVLAVLEAGGPRRDPDGYFFSIFGQPAENGTWGYRIDGHHVSQNFTIVRGQGGRRTELLRRQPGGGGEVQPQRGCARSLEKKILGRDLIQSLTPDQRQVAIVGVKAPGDILTEHSRVAALNGQPNGIQTSALNDLARRKLQTLLDEYCDNMTEDISSVRKEQIRKAGNEPCSLGRAVSSEANRTTIGCRPPPS